MSLLGRLEDLSLGDILQIVFLSRRSGKLVVRTAGGECTLFFRGGLIAGVASPSEPSIQTFLSRAGSGSGSPTREEVEAWVTATLFPLLAATSGEFTFAIAEPAQLELGYDPLEVLGADGFPPERFLGSGPKFRPLAALEETLKAGKSLLRGGERPAPAEPQLPFERPSAGSPPPPPRPTSQPERDPESTQPGRYRFSVRKASVSGGECSRVVLLFAPDPQLRVAVRRGLASSGVDVRQFHTLQEAMAEARDLSREKTFFITVAECMQLESARQSGSLLQMVRRISPELPVAVIASSETAAADALPYRPDFETVAGSVGDSQAVSSAVGSLDRFVEEQFWRWERAVADYESEAAAGEEFYDRASRESTERKYDLLEALILELSDPDDLLMIASTLIRAASEYVDRGAIFVVSPEGFSRVLAFDESDPQPGREGRRFTIGGQEVSVLAEVVSSGRALRGKLRKSAANVRLVQSFGPGVPTEAIAVPIVSGSEVVGVFYGDNAKYRQPISETAGLEIFLAQAGRAFQRAMSSGREEGR